MSHKLGMQWNAYLSHDLIEHHSKQLTVVDVPSKYLPRQYTKDHPELYVYINMVRPFSCVCVRKEQVTLNWSLKCQVLDRADDTQE